MSSNMSKICKVIYHVANFDFGKQWDIQNYFFATSKKLIEIIHIYKLYMA